MPIKFLLLGGGWGFLEGGGWKCQFTFMGAWISQFFNNPGSPNLEPIPENHRQSWSNLPFHANWASAWMSRGVPTFKNALLEFRGFVGDQAFAMLIGEARPVVLVNLFGCKLLATRHKTGRTHSIEHSSATHNRAELKATDLR